MKLPTIDYDAIAQDYAQHRQVHPEVLRKLLATGHISAASRILEVGCGTGNYVAALRSATGCSGWGLDRSAGMLTRAKTRADDVCFQLGDGHRLGYRSRSFDLVLSVDVIHHLKNQPDFYRETYRVLNAGGRVCTVTDSAWIIRHRQPLATYFPETIGVELERYPRVDTLQGLMQQTGYRQLRLETVEFRFELHDILPYQAKAFSALHLISQVAFQAGLNRLQRDLRRGPIPCVARYVLLWGTRPANDSDSL
jgi:SAM-dependent methyltransferase